MNGHERGECRIGTCELISEMENGKWKMKENEGSDGI